MKNLQEIDTRLGSIYPKLSEKEKEIIDDIVWEFYRKCEKVETAKRLYLKSLQKHNEKNEKMDDTSIKMYVALCDDRYDEYE